MFHLAGGGNGAPGKLWVQRGAERAREISKGLRCLVCQNESIDESEASLARDLRILLRERLVAGDSDQEAVDFIVARYGEYVLLQPDLRGANWLLWGAGPLMLLLAATTMTTEEEDLQIQTELQIRIVEKVTPKVGAVMEKSSDYYSNA